MNCDEIIYNAIKEKLEKGETLTQQEQEFYDYCTNIVLKTNQEEKTNIK